MNKGPKNYYRVFAPNIPNVRVISERFNTEADAQRVKRTNPDDVSSGYSADRKD